MSDYYALTAMLIYSSIEPTMLKVKNEFDSLNECAESHNTLQLLWNVFAHITIKMSAMSYLWCNDIQ